MDTYIYDTRCIHLFLYYPSLDGRVQGNAQNIPTYPVDSFGKRKSLPVYKFTPDGKIEAGLSWDPKVLLTGKDTSFVFVLRANNKPSFLQFDFVIIQGEKQLQRIPSIAQLGMSVIHENIGAVKSSDVQFNTTVFDNPNITRRQQIN